MSASKHELRNAILAFLEIEGPSDVTAISKAIGCSICGATRHMNILYGEGYVYPANKYTRENNNKAYIWAIGVEPIVPEIVIDLKPSDVFRHITKKEWQSEPIEHCDMMKFFYNMKRGGKK